MQNFSTTPRDTKPANALIINTLLFLVIEVWLMCAIRPLWQQQLSIFDSSSSQGVTGQSKPGHVGSSMQGHIIRDAKTPPFTHLRTIYMFQLSLPLMHVFGLCQDDDVDDGAYRYKCFSIVNYQDKDLHDKSCQDMDHGTITLPCSLCYKRRRKY